jgi:hypothetical protein
MADKCFFFFLYLLSESYVIRTMYCCVIVSSMTIFRYDELEFHAFRKTSKELPEKGTWMFSILCAKTYLHCLRTDEVIKIDWDDVSGSAIGPFVSEAYYLRASPLGTTTCSHRGTFSTVSLYMMDVKTVLIWKDDDFENRSRLLIQYIVEHK